MELTNNSRTLLTLLAQRRCDRVLGSVIHGDANIYLDEYRPILPGLSLGSTPRYIAHGVATYRLAIVGRILETTFLKQTNWPVLERRTEDTYLRGVIPAGLLRSP